VGLIVFWHVDVASWFCRDLWAL